MRLVLWNVKVMGMQELAAVVLVQGRGFPTAAVSQDVLAAGVAVRESVPLPAL